MAGERTQLGILEGEKPAVVVADDEAGIRILLTRALESMGCEVRTSSSVAEALDIVRSEPPHLLLTDVDMPESGGLDLLRRARLMAPDTEVVMVTGVVDTETIVEAMRLGASDYLAKPFSLLDLRTTVERAFERRHLLLENRAFRESLEERIADQTHVISAKTRELEHLNRVLEVSYEDTLSALMTALDFRDHETHGHSWRVVQYTSLIAGAMRIEEPNLTWMRWGAILHDVGKIGLPDAILHKPGKLDEEEWRFMRRHPELGFRMLEHIAFLRPALEIVLSHHERWEGGGYPQGLRGEEIPLGARIFAVVDTFDAMTSTRPYREALSIEAAVEEIERCAGTQFDPAVAQAFLGFPASTWREIRARAHGEAVVLPEPPSDLR